MGSGWIRLTQRLSATKKAVETKNTFDSGAFEKNARGGDITVGSVSSFENENEKSGMGNGIRISVSGVNNRSSSILENEGRG